MCLLLKVLFTLGYELDFEGVEYYGIPVLK